MAAHCWWCQVGVAQMGNVGTDPLGCCFECHVFACGGHAEWETGDGKWLCLSSAAAALAAGAGLPDIRTSTRIASSEDFQRRMPATARATAKHRAYYRSGGGERWLGTTRGRLGRRAGIVEGELDFLVLADALGVARFAQESVNESALGVLPVRPPLVVSGLLGELVLESL